MHESAPAIEAPSFVKKFGCYPSSSKRFYLYAPIELVGDHADLRFAWKAGESWEHANNY